VGEATKAGVNWVVVGSSVFHAPDPERAYRDLQRRAEEALLVRV
jgi:orotidine-5'-phosphate decarboxylase